jgi:hypothetical protein
MTVRYFSTAERPALKIWWHDDDGSLIDFSTSYTFSLVIGALTKTTNITGAAGAGTNPTGTPNITIAWSPGEIATIGAAGAYTARLTATTSSADRVFSFPFQLLS